jgi:hypothetical protein
MAFRRVHEVDKTKGDRDRWNRRLVEFMNQVRDSDYTEDILELVNSANGLNSSSNHYQFFCTKLVYDAWIHMGIAKRGTPPNDYNLRDFVSDDIPLQDNVRLGNLKYIIT